MGPYLSDLHGNVRVDHREQLVQRHFSRPSLLPAEGRPGLARTAAWLSLVTAAPISRTPILRRAALSRSRIVGVLGVLLLVGAGALGPAALDVAAWESEVGSGPSAQTAVAPDCRTANAMVMLLSGRIDRGIPPAAPWCAAHC